jgi:hypothetical protein
MYRQGTKVKAILATKHKSPEEGGESGSQAPCIIVLIIWK